MKAAFLDRDGVINELCYFPEAGVIDSPFTSGQFQLIPGAAEGIRLLNRLGLKVVIVSNQPGIAKKHFTKKTLAEIDRKLIRQLAKLKAKADAVYYCLHHPQAKVPSLRVKCNCRKPKPGLILKAAEELKVDPEQSYMLGDSVSDMQAGRAAGCQTIYIGRWKCDICRLMSDCDVEPDYASDNLLQAARLIKRLEAGHADLR